MSHKCLLIWPSLHRHITNIHSTVLLNDRRRSPTERQSFLLGIPEHLIDGAAELADGLCLLNDNRTKLVSPAIHRVVFLGALRCVALANIRTAWTYNRLVHVFQDHLHLQYVLRSAYFQRRELVVNVDFDVVALVEYYLQGNEMIK